MRKKLIWNSYISMIVLLFCLAKEGYGQSLITKKRTYANFQGTYERGTGLLTPLLIGSVTNAANAINGDPRNASTLSVPIGALNLVETTQFLEFTTDKQHANARTISANTPVTIKLSLAKEILGLLSSISIGTFTNLNPVSANWPLLAVGSGNNAGYNSTNRTQYYGGASLLNVLNGAGEFEITFSPITNFNGIYISLSSTLSLALSTNLFHAYITEDGIVNCGDRDKSIDVLSGTRAGSAIGGIANATGSVTSPWAIIDGTGPTTLNLGTQILSEVFYTTIFNTISKPNQIAKVILQNPGGGLLDLNLLTGLQIQPYLGNTAVGLPINSSQILSLRLLPGPEGKNELTVPIADPFDRIEIKMGGVVGALGTLTVYEVSRTFGVFLFPEPELNNKLTACEEVDLKEAILNYQPTDYDYRYYTVSNGGTAISSSIIFQSGTYYIETVDRLSGCVSERVPVHATVLPKPGKPHVTITNVIN